jgi:signal transduction histidine kinase
VSPRTQDLLLAVAVGAALVIELAVSSVVEGPVALNILVYLPVAASLLWRRRRPLIPAAMLFVCYSIAAFWLTSVEALTATMLPLLLIAYAGGRHQADVRPLLVLGAATIVTVNLGAAPATTDDWLFSTTIYGAAVFTGRGLRNRALLASELAERTERLAVEQDLRAAEAAVLERRRIARELHDVVAHTLSVMVVQAGAARRTLGRDAARSDEALQTVEATGRAALAELRRMLGFVGSGADPSAPAPLGPQPAVRDLEALVRRAGAAGLPATLTVEGDPGGTAAEAGASSPLAAGAEVAVYRIVQEALTNAIKHAGPGASATVTLRWLPEALELEVRDDGGGVDGSAPGGETELPSGGHGLIGMGERVGLFRGTLDAGPLPDGGFGVVARLPREPAAVTA